MSAQCKQFQLLEFRPRHSGVMMGYRVRASTGAGAVSVVVATPAAALSKIDEYRDDGFSLISVADMDGNAITVKQLAALGRPQAALINRRRCT